MLAERRNVLIGFAAVVLAGMASSSALAGDRHRCPKPDVDIESLKAELLPGGDDWIVRVRYKVEIEDACPQDGFELGMEIRENGYCLTDGAGQVFTVFAPLDRPVAWDGDEAKYEACIELRPPPGAIRRPDALRLHAYVTFAGDSCRLDDESTRIQYCAPGVVVEAAPAVVEVVRPAPVVHVVRPAPVVEIVRPAPVVTVVRPAPVIVTRPAVVVSRSAYAAPVVVREPRRGGFVGVGVASHDVRVRVGARW